MKESETGAAAETADAPTAMVLADMFFASKVRGAATAVGVRAVVRGKPEGLAERARTEQARLVLIDMELRFGDSSQAIRDLKANPDTSAIPVVAFCSHTNAAAIAAARAAGADRVLARSAFVLELPSLLRSLLPDAAARAPDDPPHA